MSPPVFSEDLLLQCEKQTEFLFYEFLRISSEYGSDDLRRDSSEAVEVEDVVRDPGLNLGARSRPLSGHDRFYIGHTCWGNPENRPRTPTRDIEHAYETQEKSRQIAGSPKTREVSWPRTNPGVDGTLPSRVHPADPYCEPSAVESGPAEQQLCEAARMIAQIGDKIDLEYGGRLARLENELLEMIKTAGSTLAYEVFAAHVNELVGQDRSWSNFVFILYLSKKVLQHSGSLTSRVVDYFRQFIGAAFREEVAAQRNVVQYVERGTKEL